MSKKNLLKKLQNKKRKYTMLALDQRGSFSEEYSKTLGRKAKSAEITELKKKIIKTIGKYPSAILIDPVYSRNLAKTLPKGILFCIEKSGYKEKGRERLTELQPGFSVQKAIELGAHAIKINILYNPETSKKTKEYQQGIVEKIGRECNTQKIPFLLEFVVYPVGEKADTQGFAKKFPELVIKTAKEFAKTKYNADILKIQFPCDLRYVKEFRKFSKGRKSVYTKIDALRFCKAINRIGKPWVLLTAGVPIEHFIEQLKIAKKAGCSGFLAGRAVWQDVLKIKNPEEQEKWLKTKGVKNIKKLLRIMGE
ncbi:MAG: tagatose 1,6-diphosphate aldolase [Candidatus Woesearchaeota archaeon]